MEGQTPRTIVGLAVLLVLTLTGCGGGSTASVVNNSAEPENIGQGCNIDFNSMTVSDDVGYVKYPSYGEACTLSPEVNPIALGAVFKEVLNGECVEFMINAMDRGTILGYC